jgi:NADH-quinone oxidoreductase subunit D
MMQFENAPIYTFDTVDEKTFMLNLGPQHPGTHGVLRIILKMDGEYIISADPVLGYGHRMQEKIAERMTYLQVLPYMARMDYLGALSYNLAWVSAVEKLCDFEVPERAEYIRVISVELNRIASHLLWYGAFLLDLGAFTPFLQAFADRERILDLLEYITGSRLTYCYFCFGGVFSDVDDIFLSRVKEFTAHFRKRLAEYHNLVTGNVIFQRRAKDVGVVSPKVAPLYGLTGPVLRGSGVQYDVRKQEPYSAYPRFDFTIPVGKEGCCWSRYLVRMQEFEQSTNIIEQAVQSIPDGSVRSKVPKIIKPPEGEVSMAVETPRGELVVHIVSDGSKQPYRVKFRVPSFSNLSIFSELASKRLLADALAILGSLDLVIPEIDR